jgi:predicted acetyltransferase
VSITVRTVEVADLPAYVDMSAGAFLERPPALDSIAATLAVAWDLSRVWAAFDGPRIVGSFRSFATEVTVPGGRQVQAAGVAGVGVAATHRRQGVLRRMVEAEHEAMRERGDVIGLLNASEYAIYGRFGYGMGCRQAVWRLDANATTFHDQNDTGSIEFLTPDADAIAQAKDVFEAWRPRQTGEIRRRDIVWEFQFGVRHDGWGDPWRGFVAIHRDASGTVDGYVRYHTESRWTDGQSTSTAHVDDLHALTVGAYVALWRFLAGIDWIAHVRAERRSPSERLPWHLTNPRAAVLVEQADGMFVRLHDVARALEARTYAGEGSLVIEVIDPETPGGRQRVALEAGRDGARAIPTDQSPDLTVHVAALGAAYLGGSPLSLAAIATGGADEARPGALADAERLFRTPDEPWCSTFF